jgi:hypothetical protein
MSEEEHQRIEELALRVSAEVLRFSYERHLLPKPEPINLPPEVLADLDIAMARVLKKHKIEFSVQEAPRPSRAQNDMLAQSVVAGVLARPVVKPSKG